MTGLLVINEFLRRDKFDEIHSWLIDAAMKNGINLILKTNAQLLIDISYGRQHSELAKTYEGKFLQPSVDFILFWDKDVKLAYYLEQLGYRVFNSSEAIGICDDKALTHIKLMNSGISMPRTIVAPKTFDNIGYTSLGFLQEISESIGYPMVVKEAFGSFGQQVYLVHSYDELLALFNKLGTKPVIFQEFIKSSFGRDIRLQVVGDKVIAAMLRHSETGDFRANLTIGGKMQAYEPNKEQCDLAITSCKRIGLDYAGVDLLFGDDGDTLVCEINSNAHFKNICDCTGVNAADAIINHIINEISK